MKLNDINRTINEDAKKSKNDVKDAISILRDLKPKLDNRVDKQKVDKALTKLRSARDDMPNGDFDVFKKLVMKVLTFPIRMFDI